MTELECIKGLKYLGLAFSKEFTEDECKVYYDFLKDFKFNAFRTAIKELIRQSKYFPKISEIVDMCERTQKNIRIDVIEFMDKQGYFKAAVEYEKTKHFILEGVVPEWLAADINRYYMMMITGSTAIEGNNQLLIE